MCEVHTINFETISRAQNRWPQYLSQQLSKFICQASSTLAMVGSKITVTSR